LREVTNREGDRPPARTSGKVFQLLKVLVRGALHMIRPANKVGPPDPKISIFRPPPVRIFISVMASLGVGKRQPGGVLFKSALLPCSLSGLALEFSLAFLK